MNNTQIKNQRSSQDLTKDTDMSNNMDDFDDLAANYDGTSEGVLGGQAASTNRDDNHSVLNKSNPSGKGKQGFVSMDTNRQREIASLGGKAAHEQKSAHEWDSNEAKQARKIGGSR
jgi:general stress protein YciG